MNRCLAALAAVLLVFLAGCGKDADPPPVDPSVSVSVSPTTSATTPLVMPDAASRQTKAGAIAFVKYYFKVIDYSQRTGDTRPMSMLQQNDCASCIAGRKWIDRVVNRGGQIQGGAHRIRKSVVQIYTSRTAALLLTLNVEPQAVTGAGDMNHRYAGGREVVRIAINASRGEWKVADWRVIG